MASAYSYVNSRGTTFYLHSKEVRLRGKELRIQRIYFFAKNVRDDDACSSLPEGYGVMENAKTAFPVLKKI